MKTKIVFLLFYVFYLNTTFTQNSTNSDLSIERQVELARRDSLISLTNLTKNDSIELNHLLNKYEGTGSVWDVLYEECSWYCGGGNYKIYASSSLESSGTLNYSAKSANDLSYKTAWVEGVKGTGIGEFLEFTFKNNSPRITKILIANGYFKNENVWIENNRVKRIKLYVNNTFYKILILSDVRTTQSFDVKTLGKNKDGTDLVLRFEILEVYKGTKYDDTAITEIYFDGIDVH